MFELTVPSATSRFPDNFTVLPEKSKTASFPRVAPCAKVKTPAVESNFPPARASADCRVRSADPLSTCEAVVSNVTAPLTVRSLVPEPSESALFCRLMLPNVNGEPRERVASAESSNAVFVPVVTPSSTKPVPNSNLTFVPDKSRLLSFNSKVGSVPLVLSCSAIVKSAFKTSAELSSVNLSTEASAAKLRVPLLTLSSPSLTFIEF